MIPSIKQEIRANQKGAIARLESVKGYIRQMETYLKHNVWLSNFAGEDQNKKVVWECVVPAYDKEGNIKRQNGVYYKDLGFVWGEQDDDID